MYLQVHTMVGLEFFTMSKQTESSRRYLVGIAQKVNLKIQSKKL